MKLHVNQIPTLIRKNKVVAGICVLLACSPLVFDFDISEHTLRISFESTAAPPAPNCQEPCSEFYDLARDKRSRVDLKLAKQSVRLFGKFNNSVDQILLDKMPTLRRYFWSSAPHAFTMQKSTMLKVANYAHGSDTATGARVYMGVVGGGIHLFMVPVVRDSVDVIPTDSAGAFVYDFITPCPNHCDAASADINSLERAFRCGNKQYWPIDTLRKSPCVTCSEAIACE